MMSSKLKIILTTGIAIIILTVISGCIEEQKTKKEPQITINTSSPTPFCPVAKRPSNFSMTALLEGKLVLEDGCLRVNTSSSCDYLPVWPHGFSISTGDEIQIINDSGKPVALVGHRVKLGGGECIEPCNIENYSTQFPSDRCSGPYWIVGEVVDSK